MRLRGDVDDGSGGVDAMNKRLRRESRSRSRIIG